MIEYQFFRFLIGCWYYEKKYCFERNDLFLQVLIRSLQFPVRLVFPALTNDHLVCFWGRTTQRYRKNSVNVLREVVFHFDWLFVWAKESNFFPPLRSISRNVNKWALKKRGDFYLRHDFVSLEKFNGNIGDQNLCVSELSSIEICIESSKREEGATLRMCKTFSR